MTAIKSIAAVALLVACLLVCLCQGQTLTYSDGWVNGKRSPASAWSDFVPTAAHRSDPHVFPGNGPVLISDIQLGRNYLCFVVNSQLTDNLVNFGLKSADYPATRSRPSN